MVSNINFYEIQFLFQVLIYKTVIIITFIVNLIYLQ